MEPERPPTDAATLQQLSDRTIGAMQDSGWHPLLHVQVRNDGQYQRLEGYDPIDELFCYLICKAESSFDDNQPTFIRVSEPQRVECEIEQLHLNQFGLVELKVSDGWFGGKGVGDVLLIKGAIAGDVSSMKELAWSRSFEHQTNYVNRAINTRRADLRSAMHWFRRACGSGCTASRLATAFLEDVSDKSDTQGEVLIYLPLDIGEIIKLAEAKSENLKRAEAASSTMDASFYRNNVKTISKRLASVCATGTTPRLKRELERI